MKGVVPKAHAADLKAPNGNLSVICYNVLVLKSPVTFFALGISFMASVSVLLFVDRHLGLSVLLEWIRTKAELKATPSIARLRV